MKKLYLTNSSRKALVDDEDFERCNYLLWHLDNKRVRSSKRISLARFILNDYTSEVIDHISRDPLDNQKKNLRSTTAKENNRNRSIASNNTSGYHGVSWHSSHKKWAANIRVNNILIFLGYFTTPERASEAYKKAAIKYFGEFANIGDS